jgi:hypothetical protein
MKIIKILRGEGNQTSPNVTIHGNGHASARDLSVWGSLRVGLVWPAGVAWLGLV